MRLKTKVPETSATPRNRNAPLLKAGSNHEKPKTPRHLRGYDF